MVVFDIFFCLDYDLNSSSRLSHSIPSHELILILL
jgi:hypothetical protein